MRYLLVCLVFAAGCSDSFVANDGGPADTGGDLGHDGGPQDSGVRDLGTYDGSDDCSEVGGYRPCDERCPQPCESPATCLDEIGLCVVAPSIGSQEACNFTAVGVVPRHGKFCSRSGGPCLVDRGSGSGGTEGWQGFCLGADVCLDAEGRGLPFTCRYSDGSVVVTGPPSDTCPPAVTDAPFCGGSCGTLAGGCPDTSGMFGTNVSPSCIGLSDERAHGVCVYNEYDCEEIWTNFGADGLAVILDACRSNYGAPCVCMQLAAGPEGPLSYFANGEACVRYRAQYPGSVECLDATHTPLP